MLIFALFTSLHTASYVKNSEKHDQTSTVQNSCERECGINNFIIELSEEEYGQIAETHQKLVNYLLERKTPVYDVSRAIVKDFFLSNFSVDKNTPDNRKLFDFASFPLMNFYDSKGVGNFEFAFQSMRNNCISCPQLDKFFSIVEMLASTKTFSRIVSKGVKTKCKDFNKIIACIYAILHVDFGTPHYFTTLKHLAKSFLYEITKILQEKIKKEENFTKENIKYALWDSSLLSNSEISFKFQYSDDSCSPISNDRFILKPDVIILGWLSITRNPLSDSKTTSDVRIQKRSHKRYEKDDFFRDTIDFDDDNYVITSFLFEDDTDSNSSNSYSHSSVFRYNTVFQRFLDCTGEILELEELDELWEKYSTLTVCYEKVESRDKIDRAEENERASTRYCTMS